MVVRSYSATRLGPVGRARELAALYRMRRHDVRRQVRATVDRLDEADAAVARVRGGEPLRDADVLVVGPGQHLGELAYWGRRGNRVVGIDLDPYSGRTTLAEHLRGLRRDGSVRTLKTVGRRLSGIDAAYGRELRALLGDEARRAPTVLAMDAEDTSFADGSFDLVYSRSVFEHLRDADAVMREISRVLRPGGVAYVDVHLYTSDSGCHDARIFAGRREELPYWSHLREEYADRVRPNSYLNERRLDDWEEAFARSWPDVVIERQPTRDPRAADELAAIRAAGDLADHRDDELLTLAVVATWRRPEEREPDAGDTTTGVARQERFVR